MITLKKMIDIHLTPFRLLLIVGIVFTIINIHYEKNSNQFNLSYSQQNITDKMESLEESENRFSNQLPSNPQESENEIKTPILNCGINHNAPP